jgi:hypothetical protein
MTGLPRSGASRRERVMPQHAPGPRRPPAERDPRAGPGRPRRHAAAPGGGARHRPRRRGPLWLGPGPRRGVAVLTVLDAVVSLSVTAYACVLAAQQPGPGTAARSAAATFGGPLAPGMRPAARHPVPGPRTDPGERGMTGKPTAGKGGGGTVRLTARDRRRCPRAATACVDIAEKITWLQAGGKVSYGPVRMEPGPPGTAHATPTGTFYVAWKAGPTYMSTSYHELIPWAVFFAPGGIAFHAGSLTLSSHGCVHLTMASAYYYNQHLPVGAEVVVF